MSSQSPSQVIEQFSWLPVIDRATFNNASHGENTSGGLSDRVDQTQQGSYSGTLQPDMEPCTPQASMTADLSACSWIPSLDNAPRNAATRVGRSEFYHT